MMMSETQVKVHPSFVSKTSWNPKEVMLHIDRLKEAVTELQGIVNSLTRPKTEKQPEQTQEKKTEKPATSK